MTVFPILFDWGFSLFPSERLQLSFFVLHFCPGIFTYLISIARAHFVLYSKQFFLIQSNVTSSITKSLSVPTTCYLWKEQSYYMNWLQICGSTCYVCYEPQCMQLPLSPNLEWDSFKHIVTTSKIAFLYMISYLWCRKLHSLYVYSNVSKRRGRGRGTICPITAHNPRCGYSEAEFWDAFQSADLLLFSFIVRLLMKNGSNSFCLRTKMFQ